MAESKFAGIFKQAPPPPPEPEPEPEALQPSPTRAQRAAPLQARPIGRPPGKRSDPQWKQFSVLLKRGTQRAATDILRQRDDGQDLSGLVQNLLENWVKRQRP